MKPFCIVVCALATLASSCFVSESECVRRGVVVEPCAISAKAGQTVILTAGIPGAPGEPVDWILPASAASAFEVVAEPNRLVLVSKQNLAGVYPVQASSQTNPLAYGGTAVGVSSASFGSQAPPFVLFGGDLPVGSKASATAAGGNLYYVAFADAGNMLQAGPGLNFYVQQYRLSTNQLLATVTGQFLLFTGTQTQTPIVPNVAADCAGNGYWVDAVGTGAPNYVLRRLAPGSTSPTEQSLGQFDDFLLGTLASACDGSIYFLAVPVGASEPELFRIAAFGSAPQSIRLNPSALAFEISSLSVDVRGRLLCGSDSPDFFSGIGRLLLDLLSPDGPTASLDSSFDTQGAFFVVTDVSSDSAGVVYAAVEGFKDGPFIAAFNELGALIYTISEYEYFCPSGCELPLCGTPIPFTRILSLAASPGGALRIVDDPDTGNLPVECQESLRFILIDPD